MTYTTTAVSALTVVIAWWQGTVYQVIAWAQAGSVEAMCFLAGLVAIGAVIVRNHGRVR